MYNLIKYRSNFSNTTGSFWFYSKDKATNFGNYVVNTDDRKPFKYKAKFLGDTVDYPNSNQANRILKNTTNIVSLEYLSRFCRLVEI